MSGATSRAASLSTKQQSLGQKIQLLRGPRCQNLTKDDGVEPTPRPSRVATLSARDRGRSEFRKIGSGGMADTPETLKAAANELFKGTRLSVFRSLS